ncbi:hypothetical protein Aple_090980 [Acrocarpospora pleiomorpha]|uniref:Leucine-binding protein domain-containing protein n=1 Tax=Acrocarpospora pleiomorpha TaxID=90975 RepID=A0A5M3Y1Y0_9ACTN|nr:ABC transporter substrate-binding protein [Acrocarpospora pleiomorpha]GES26199.1 hypothetical protein Aple_090980 [Acrocarpospora pleiomorpha]
MRKKFAVVAAVMSLSTAAACGSDGGTSSVNDHVIEIGAVLSLTGPFAAQGEAHLGSIKLGIDQVTKAGGITVNGQKYTFAVTTKDSASDPAKATAGVLGMIRDEGVKYLIGPADTPSVVAAESVVTKQDVLWLAGSTYISGRLEAKAGDPAFAKIFGTNPSAATVFPAAVNGALQYQPGTKTAAIVWPSGAASDPYVELIEKAFAAKGVDVVDKLRFDIASTDFSGILTKLKSYKPDIVFTGTTSGAVQAFASQAVQLGSPFGSMIVLGATAGTGLTGNNGKPLPFPYMYIMNRGLDPYTGNPDVTQLFQQYEQVNGKPPALDAQLYATEFTSSINALARAMEKAGTVDDPDAVAKALKTVSVNAGNGDVSFAQNGVLQAPIAVCELRDGDGTCKLVTPGQ